MPTLVSTLAIALLASLAACGADAPTAARPEPVPDDTVFDETVLIRRADGSIEATTRTITAGEERRQNQRRADRADRALASVVPVVPVVQQDTTCAGRALWLYDRTDLTGNRICFDDLDTPPGYTTSLYIANYVRVWRRRPNGLRYPVAYWDIPSGSYWPGARAGWILGDQPEVDAGVDDPRSAFAFGAWGDATPFQFTDNRLQSVLL